MFDDRLHMGTVQLLMLASQPDHALAVGVALEIAGYDAQELAQVDLTGSELKEECRRTAILVWSVVRMLAKEILDGVRQWDVSDLKRRSYEEIYAAEAAAKRADFWRDGDTMDALLRTTWKGEKEAA